MKYGTVLAVADPRPIPELAQAAEDAGWDAVFLADPVWGVAPWVTLAACASVTERIRLGTMLTPPSAWRPWKLAAEVATLDNLSEGRAILSVGLGATDAGFDNVGEETDRRVRAQLLDEGLDVITGLWSGQPFGYEGRHYTVTPIDFPPPPPTGPATPGPDLVRGGLGLPQVDGPSASLRWATAQRAERWGHANRDPR